MSETRPDVTGSSPARHSSAVDLPEPLGPTSAVIRPGIMAQEMALRPLLEAALRDRLPPHVYEATKIAFAATANDAGMLGALCHFLQEHGERI